MADDVSAGRLHLDAYADTSGFARDAKAKIDAEVKNLRAKIKTELETRGLVTQAKAAAKTARDAAVVRLRTELDTRSVVATAKRAAQEASRAASVKIKAEIDEAKFRTDLTKAVASMSGAYSVTVGVDVDTTAAQARLAAFRAGQRSLPINMGVNINTGNLGQVLSRFSMFPALAGGVYLLVGAVGQLAGGLVAVASSASQAVVGLAALPNLVGAIGMGVATLFAGLSGIGAGVQALGEADQASAQNTAKAADIRTNSARAVADAQRQLKDAYHQAEDASRQAGYAVQDAEWGLARAQEEASEAQERLNEAREAARERIDDLNESLERAALTELTAANNLAKARAALADVMFDRSSSGQEERDAQLAVDQAEQDLKDAKGNREEVAKATREANAEGVRGSQEVEQARDDLRDANHGVMLAERQLFEARHSAADTAASNAQMIADAQRAIADAQQGGTQAIQAQNVALAQQASEFDKLSPAAQRFARFLFDRVMPRFATLRDRVQEALLPPLQEGITRAMPLIDTLEDGLVGTADVIGDLAVRVGTLFGSKGFNDDTAQIMSTNNRALRILGGAAFNLIKILSDLAVVAGPTLLVPFAKWVRTLTRTWREAAQVGRETGTMRERFIRARESASLLGSIIANLWSMLRGLGRAATPTGDALLQTFDQASERWANWANSDAGQQRMTQFFEAIDKPFREFMSLLGELSRSLVLMAESGGGPVAGMLATLAAVFRGLNAVLATPYLGTAVGWLLTAAGGVGALGLLAGVMVRIGGAFSLLARVSGLTRLWNAFRLSLLGTRIGLALIWVQSKLAAAGMWLLRAPMLAVTGLMRLMRAAATLMFGPWGLAIAAAVGLFVLLYKKVDWFRAAVQWVMGKVVDAFNWVKEGAIGLWDELFGHSVFPDIVAGLQWFWGIVQAIFGFVRSALTVLGTAFSWLWRNAVQPAWTAIQKAVSIAWNYYYKPILKALWTALQVAGKVVMWLWRNAVVPAFKGIQTAIRVAWPVVKRIFGLVRDGLRVLGSVFRWLWRNIVQPAWRAISKIIKVAWLGIRVYFRALGAGLSALGKVFSWLWRNVVQPVWRSIQRAIEFAWERIIKPVFRALDRGIDLLGAAMEWLWKRAIEPAWDGIKSAVNTVWTFLRDRVFDPLMRLVKTTIPNAFSSAKDAIERIWDKLKGIAASPVKFIVDTVYTRGIKAVIDKIPGVDNLPGVSFNYARGTSSVLPGYTPGRDVHNFRSADGKMGLNLSGGEAIMRPEWTRVFGTRAIDSMNAIAARGTTALRKALGTDGPGRSPSLGQRVGQKVMGYATGGIMRFASGGVNPMPGATMTNFHGSNYLGTGAWAGDYNGPGGGNTDENWRAVAWKAGRVVAALWNGEDGSYGNRVEIDHGGSWTRYAHLNSIKVQTGQQVAQGQTIGLVGGTGNDGGSAHLHFEIIGGTAPTAGGAGGAGKAGPSPAERKARNEASGWRDAIGAIKNTIQNFPDMIGNLADRGGWGPMLTDAVRHIGSGVRQWINDKIPDSINVPGPIPNIPLPDNPIPSLFDRGGDWHSGKLGANLSGKTETVFTNENIVDLTSDLGRIAAGLRSQTVDGGSGGAGGGVRIDNLELSAPPEKVQQVLGDMQHALRILSLGGVHAKRIAGASV